MLIVGLLNESVGYLMIRIYRNNLLNSNIYTLVEFVLFLWFFYRIKQQKFIWLLVAGSLGLAAWMLDNLWLHSIMESNSIFRIFSSLIIVWLSIDKITQLILNGIMDPFKKSDLLFCFGFFAYFTYRSFIHIFKLFTLSHPPSFYADFWLILAILNILINITYTIGILWIPKQQEPMAHS